MWGIIGGSGFEKFDGFEVLEVLPRETPFGLASSGFKRVRINGEEALFLSRHGEHHELTPTEVNYRANTFAMKKNGAKAIVSFSAVGSLHQPYKPGDMVVPTQYIDRTKGIRNHTFCGDGVVGHMSLAHPICKSTVEKVQPMTKGLGFDCHFAKTYICIEGPNFSTQAESKTYRAAGADIIGMTHFPEYSLIREAGLSYLPCCFVTDYDCWDDSIPHVTLDEVIRVMRQNNVKAFTLLKQILASKNSLYEACDCANQGLKNGLMTHEDVIPAAAQEWLQVLR